MEKNELIKKLREETLVSFSLCKEALENSNWDLEKAKDYLRKKGALKFSSRAKQTNSGIIESYVHQGKIGVLVELKCETDFVASNSEFKKLAHEIALQIASMKPKYVSDDQISQEEKEEFKKIVLEQDPSILSKPKDVQEKILNGKMEKWYQEVVLLKQPWIKDQNLKIEDLINENSLKFGEKIQVGRFYILEL